MLRARVCLFSSSRLLFLFFFLFYSIRRFFGLFALRYIKIENKTPANCRFGVSGIPCVLLAPFGALSPLACSLFPQLADAEKFNEFHLKSRKPVFRSAHTKIDR